MGVVEVTICTSGIMIILVMIILAASIRVVREETRLSVYRLGRYIGEKGPGLVFLLPFIDRGILKQVGAAERTPGQQLVGVIGETRTTVYTDGKVLLMGEEWDAVSRTAISAGERVRVARIIVEVERE
jgi:membrane-bound ClpP family serine protease